MALQKFLVRHLLTIFLVVFCVASFAQVAADEAPTKPPKPLSKHQAKIEQENHTCIYRDRYTTLQRLDFYPFSKASKVQIVSYDVKLEATELDAKTGNKLPIANDTVCYSQLDEITTLSTSEIDSLTDILYNIGFKGPIHIMSFNMCFIPRNAILFIDSLGRTFDYVEICFQCRRTETSSENIELGEFCDEKYELLKNFFISLGLEIGTIRGTYMEN